MMIPPFKFTLSRQARIFENPFKMTLARNGHALDPGDVVIVEKFENKVYDHRTVVAAAIKIDGQRYYLLAEEIGLANAKA